MDVKHLAAKTASIGVGIAKLLALALALVAALFFAIALGALLLALWVLLRAFNTTSEDPAAVLAEVIHEPEQAQLLLATAGFPRSRIPRFTTPLAFWTRALEEARNGVLPGGIRPILDRARGLYPNNARLAGC